MPKWLGGGHFVALHPEGVDRNTEFCIISVFAVVALHPEGVDRNWSALAVAAGNTVALHPEGVDRNRHVAFLVFVPYVSPSTQRAWIEIELNLRADRT